MYVVNVNGRWLQNIMLSRLRNKVKYTSYTLDINEALSFDLMTDGIRAQRLLSGRLYKVSELGELHEVRIDI